MVTLDEATLRQRIEAGTHYVASPLKVPPLGLLRMPEVSGDVLEKVIRSLPASMPRPIVSIQGIRVVGPLDLSDLKSQLSIVFCNSAFDGEVLMMNSTVSKLVMLGCNVQLLSCDGMETAGDVNLSGSTSTARDEHGCIRLVGARIGGQLSLRSAQLQCSYGSALVADGMHVLSDAFIDAGFNAVSHRTGETLRMPSARVDGDLSFRGASVRSYDGPAILADNAEVGGRLHVDNCNMVGSGRSATFGARGVRVKSHVSMQAAAITNDAGPALNFESLECPGFVNFGGSTLTGVGPLAVVHMPYSDIGTVILEGARIANDSGPCVDLIGSRIAKACYLGGSAELLGFGPAGSLTLSYAHISGSLLLGEGTIRNYLGPAIVAIGLHVQADIRLNPGLRTQCHGGPAAICVHGAQVGGDFMWDNVEANNNDGPAIHAGRIVVGGDLIMSRVRATGFGVQPCIYLAGASAGRLLRISECRVVTSQGSSISLDGASADSVQVAGCAIRGGSERESTVRLSGVRVRGQLALSDLSIENTGHASHVTFQEAQIGTIFISPRAIGCKGTQGVTPCSSDTTVDLTQCSYSAFGNGDSRLWLHYLNSHMGEYRGQPFQQLAGVLRLQGDEESARLTLMSQNTMLRRKGKLSRYQRGASLAMQFILGYGYRVRRAVGLLLVILIVSGSLGMAAGNAHDSNGRTLLHHSSRSANPGTPCSLFEQVVFGPERSVPFATSAARDRCELDTASTGGQFLATLFLALQLLAWSMVTLAVVGYTNMVRKI
ncbi:MAG TPA: hypothetical protein VGD67_25120 [Pseudonocardiaceae bacterium]